MLHEPKKAVPRFLLEQIRRVRGAHPADLRTELLRLRALMGSTFTLEDAIDPEPPELDALLLVPEDQHQLLLTELDVILDTKGQPNRALWRALGRMIQHLTCHESGAISRMQEDFQRDIGGSG
jgi:hypothetical protein